ncbi:MAG: hypothetical protein RR397_07935 [Odoribacter sp.]
MDAIEFPSGTPHRDRLEMTDAVMIQDMVNLNKSPERTSFQKIKELFAGLVASGESGFISGDEIYKIKLALDKISGVSEAIDATNLATANANIAAANADAKAVLAEEKTTAAMNSAQTANAAAANTNQKTVELSSLTTNKIAELEAFKAALSAASVFLPTGLVLEYSPTVTYRNTVSQRICATILPGGSGNNTLFLGAPGAVEVSPDGGYVIKHPGISIIHAIPTANTGLYKTITITVIPPVLRKHSGVLRLLGNGKLRLI